MSNQPAFPTPTFWNGEQDGALFGMTLRDYFAAKAMQQTMIEFSREWETHAYEQSTFLDWAAQRSYAMADAMMKARAAE